MYSSKQQASCFYCEWVGWKHKAKENCKKKYPEEIFKLKISENSLTKYHFWKETTEKREQLLLIMMMMMLVYMKNNTKQILVYGPPEYQFHQHQLWNFLSWWQILHLCFQLTITRFICLYQSTCPALFAQFFEALIWACSLPKDAWWSSQRRSNVT